jgi:hypothetical protein
VRLRAGYIEKGDHQQRSDRDLLRWQSSFEVSVVGCCGGVAHRVCFQLHDCSTNTGLGLGDSYASFQTGSNFGNVLALVIWSCAALLSARLASRWSCPTWVRALVAYGVPAAISLYPSAVVSNAVAHVVAVDDAFVYQDWLALPLMVSGLVALVAALIGGVLPE